MRRKVTFLLLVSVALVLSFLVVICELPRFTDAGAPAPLESGASPQRLGCKAHGVAPPAGAVSALLYPTSRKGPVEWAAQPRWMAVPLAERSTSLRRVAVLGTAIQRGEYAVRTDPWQLGSILAVVKAAWAKTAPLLLFMTAYLAAMIVAKRGGEAQGRAEAGVQEVVTAPCGPSRLPILKPMPGRRYSLAPSGPWALITGDRIADWERVRLVPT